MKHLFLLMFFLSTLCSYAQDKINLQNTSFSGTSPVAIVLNEKAEISNARAFSNKNMRGQHVFTRLRQVAKNSQKEVVQLLKRKQIRFQSFYIVNMVVADLDMETIRELAALPSVKTIIDNGKVDLLQPITERDKNISTRAIEWGLTKIGAPDVWSMGFTGQGVVIGGQDTGYEWDHQALKAKYRGWNGTTADHDYNWHDAIHNAGGTNPCGSDSPFPCDDHNHGTHTMGTMVGDDGGSNQIGVAPGAKWMACRNMDQGNGTLSTYVECFEWFLAPYPVGGTPDQGDPTQAPHVINNSWSCPPSEGCNLSNFPVMEEALNNLRNSGVVVVVSNGNSGSSCETTDNPPALFEGSFSVGATNSSDLMANFSSRGPVDVDGSGRLKPNVVAPGVSVRSSIRGGTYTSLSGTSMAGPHVAGTVALMISANPSLAGQVEKIESILEQTAVPISTAQECGGLLPSQIPNYVFGYGRIDAKAAVTRAMDELYVPFIKVDQFGYQPTSEKFAFLSNPVDGYNNGTAYSAPSTVYLRDAHTHQNVFSGSPLLWNSGATDALSGDQVWWFDFSVFTQPGTYYVSDNQYRSEDFVIGDGVYDDVLIQAFKTFYLQRCGHEKSTPFTDAGYADPACHSQDVTCKYIFSPGDNSFDRDLSGGWHDAGDYNKYVNFAYPAVMDLLTAYEINPHAWSDEVGIPESGNGIPDLLDEVKVELDWLLKMQEADGGVLSVVGTLNYQGATPPSADGNVRYYGPSTTSASLSAAAMMAYGALQFKKIDDPTAQVYASTLESAAIDAYDWAALYPDSVYFNTGSTLAAGEQELSDTYARDMRKLSSAIFLYDLTKNTAYKTYVESNYTNAHLLQWTYAYVWESQTQDNLLYFASLPGVSASVKTAIENAYRNSLQNNGENIPSIINQTGAYRSYLQAGNTGWGSNREKCNKGNMFQIYRHYNLNNTNDGILKTSMEDFIHYMHGSNPLGFCYLTHMQDFGAERSVNTIYHGWFADGHTDWDDVRYSTYGPPPGFIPGGPNPGWSLDNCCSGSCSTDPLCTLLSPPSGQPPLKSYYDWNASWPQNSWSVTENAIYYQSAYLLLLSSMVNDATALNDVSQVVRIIDADLMVLNPAEGIILTSPDLTHYMIAVDNTGTITTSAISSFSALGSRISSASLFIDQQQLGTIISSPDTNNWRVLVDNSGKVVAEPVISLPPGGSEQMSGSFIIEDPNHGLILKDKDGYCYLVKVSNGGGLFAAPVSCP